MKGNNVTYTGKTWRKKTYWEDLDTEPPESPTFIHRFPRYHTSNYSHNNPSYLPYNFHYYGMDKLKGGKGYKKDGTPIGIIGGPCPECEGTIINLQINTSSRGMETTSEKVCDMCGLIIDGAFNISRHKYEPFELREQPDYHTRPFDTHEDWLERMKELDSRQGNPEDIAVETEIYTHVTGHRPDDDTVIEGNGSGYKEHGIGNQDENLARALGLKTKNAANYGNKHKDVQEYRKKQYYDYIDICKSTLHMHRGQVAEARYIIDNEPSLMKLPYPYEDIIYHMCLRLRLLGMGRKGTKLMNSERLGDRYNKTVYSAVRSKLNI